MCQHKDSAFLILKKRRQGVCSQVRADSHSIGIKHLKRKVGISPGTSLDIAEFRVEHVEVSEASGDFPRFEKRATF